MRARVVVTTDLAEDLHGEQTRRGQHRGYAVVTEGGTGVLVLAFCWNDAIADTIQEALSKKHNVRVLPGELEAFES